RRPPSCTPVPYTTLFRSKLANRQYFRLWPRPEEKNYHCQKSGGDHGNLPPCRPFLQDSCCAFSRLCLRRRAVPVQWKFHCFALRSEEHTSELQSRGHLVC